MCFTECFITMVMTGNYYNLLNIEIPEILNIADSDQEQKLKYIC